MAALAAAEAGSKLHIWQNPPKRFYPRVYRRGLRLQQTEFPNKLAQKRLRRGDGV